jgi:hypothetical protein
MPRKKSAEVKLYSEEIELITLALQTSEAMDYADDLMEPGALSKLLNRLIRAQDRA